MSYINKTALRTPKLFCVSPSLVLIEGKHSVNRKKYTVSYYISVTGSPEI